MLHQFAPAATIFGLLTNPENPVFNQLERRQVETAARSLGLELLVADAKDQDEIDAAFPKLIARGAHAILVGGDPVFVNGASQIAALAARYAMPTIASGDEYPKAGGLISYGYDVVAAIRLAGTYVGRILKGEKPADMPVQQMTKFEMVINLKTAKALGLTIPAG